MELNDHPVNREKSLYSRVELRLLRKLPAFITPLRFRVLIGYLVVFVMTIYGWEQLAAAWRYLLALLAPAFALVSALMALKLGVVLLSLFTLLVSMLKFFFGFLVVVLKPGILKAIFVPQLISFAGWIHKKSERLQGLIKKFYDYLKSLATRLMDWWKAQHRVDKLLLSGFLVPLLIILLLVFIIKRAVAIFAVKKFSEQIVQKTTKFVIKHFHKLPIIGAVPSKIANLTRRFTAKEDRDDVVEDFKDLSHEIYQADDNDSKSQSSTKTSDS